LDKAEATIIRLLRLRDRILNGSSIMGLLVWRQLGPPVYQVARTQASLLPDDAALQHLADIIENEGRRPLELAEIFRHELQNIELYEGDGLLISSEFNESLAPLAPIFGSTKAHRLENCRIVYSHIIAELERDPLRANPSVEIRKFTATDASWKNLFRADPVTRFAMARSVNMLDHLFPDPLRNSEAQRRLTLAVIAIYRHKLKTSNWPEALAAAMPDVPLDPHSDPPAPLQYKISPTSGTWEITTKGEASVSSDEFLPVVKP
jgi:hypothetical protein